MPKGKTLKADDELALIAEAWVRLQPETKDISGFHSPAGDVQLYAFVKGRPYRFDKRMYGTVYMNRNLWQLARKLQQS